MQVKDLSAEQARRLSILLDEATDLAPAQRGAWLSELAQREPQLCGLVGDLLAAMQASDGGNGDRDGLETADLIAHRFAQATQAADSLEGRVFGPYRVLRLLGQGGMGSVWLAERADGLFARQVALKLVHSHLASHALSERFGRERSILAALAHPHIARLLDAGVSAEGQPYLALEYVEGTPLAAYCDAERLGVRARVSLVVQVLSAVQHAHQNLVVHRDLKPSNILVTRAGQTQLLDFGIAKLMVEGEARETELTQAGGRALTLDYASPEQIAGQPITTASDVYSMGVVLYELLCGQRPYSLARESRGALEDAILHAEPGRPSQCRFTQGITDARSTTTRKLEQALVGDLDTIVLKALKKNPAERYPTADAFMRDLQCHLADEPVAARPDSSVYRVRKLVRRNKTAVAAATAVAVALTAGLGVALWQASIARTQTTSAVREAKRESTTKDFLVSVFKASDPRIASDRPRGSITARELLDFSSARIEREFERDPDTQIQLLGIVADIYAELDQNDTFMRLTSKQIDLARRQYGELHPVVINGLLKQADDANTRGERAEALALLDRADGLIQRAGLERASERAYWWFIRGIAVEGNAELQKDRVNAFRRADDLYTALGASDSRHAFVLSALGGISQGEGDYERAADYTRRSIAIAEKVADRDDGALSLNYSNLGKTLSYQGDFDAAERAHAVAVRLAGQTYGTDSWYYWTAAANQAQTAHLRGDRERARDLFEGLLKFLPDASKKYRNSIEENAAARVVELYGSCLSAEGRPQLAIPWLVSAEHGYTEAPIYHYDLHHVHGELGVAYDRTGRTDDARRLLKSALDGYVASFRVDDPGVLRQRVMWGTFLLNHGDAPGADAQFHEVLNQSHDRKLFSVALAHAGMASIAIKQHDGPAAVGASGRALEMFDHVTGYRDVRMGPALWRIRAEALLASGDARGAVEWARRALASYRAYDEPASLDIAAAEATLLAAVKASRLP